MRRLSGILVTVFVFGCSDDDAPPPAVDAGTDGGSDSGPTCDTAPEPPAAGDPMGHADPLGVAAGEARAGRVSAEDLPAHPGGMLTWKAGDFVLANEHVAFVIEDAGASDLYDPFGGKVVGVARMSEGRMIEPADYNEVIVGLGRFVLEPESVSVVSDGSSGAAVVRARGTLRAIPFVSDSLGAIIAGNFDGYRASVDYTLEPGARYLEIAYDVANERPNSVYVPMPLALFFQQYRMSPWAPGIGFEIDTGVDFPYLAFVQDSGTSYAWEYATGPFSLSLQISGALAVVSDPFSLDACGVTRYEVARLHAGGPGLDGLLGAIAETNGETLRTVTGIVTSGGEPLAGVRVHATDAAGTHLSRVTTDAEGRYSLSVPTGDARVQAYRGGVLGDPVTVPASGEADIVLPAAGTIHVRASDADMAPMPARVQVMPVTAIPRAPASFGEASLASGRLRIEYPMDGDVSFDVPPGQYDVVVSRGYEYELTSERVTVTTSETAEVDAVLERVVDTTDHMCGDFHIHTSRSPDSSDDGLVKLESGIADGLEIPVRSDHEWVGSFEPLIASEDLLDRAFSIGSIELTTFAWGHFGVFPLAARPEMVNDGSFDWAGRLPPAVFGDVRARNDGMGEPAIIVNHPRSSGGGFGGYFTAADYDPATGIANAPDYWDEEIDLVEVFNDSDFDDNFEGDEAPVIDWFSFLDRGRRVFAVGSSDSHHISGSPLGYPRTCIDVGTDSAVELRTLGPTHVRDRLLAGRATVSGGIYVDADVGGVGPGGDVTGTGTVAVHVRVQAASWVSADRLRAFVNGTQVIDVPLDESTRDPTEPEVRFDDDVMLDIPARASWVVFVASGSESLEPVHPGRDPFGVTNPIFFAP